MFNTTHALPLILLVLLLAAACGDTLEQENVDATVTAVGPISLDSQDRLVITYAIRDLEGDDQNLVLQICEKGAKQCGTPNPAAKNSGSLKSLPTLPAQSDVTYTYTFDTACGRIVDNKNVPFNLNTSYMVRIQIQDSESQLDSAEFSLGTDLDLAAIPSCP